MFICSAWNAGVILNGKVFPLGGCDTGYRDFLEALTDAVLNMAHSRAPPVEDSKASALVVDILFGACSSWRMHSSRAFTLSPLSCLFVCSCVRIFTGIDRTITGGDAYAHSTFLFGSPLVVLTPDFKHPHMVELSACVTGNYLEAKSKHSWLITHFPEEVSEDDMHDPEQWAKVDTVLTERFDFTALKQTEVKSKSLTFEFDTSPIPPKIPDEIEL